MTLRALLLLATVFAVVGCGGRATQLMQTAQPLDNQLSCVHLRGELENNKKRQAELRTESGEAATNNLGYAVTSPLFMDLSTTVRDETEALTRRNERISELMDEKGCDASTEEDAASSASLSQ